MRKRHGKKWSVVSGQWSVIIGLLFLAVTTGAQTPGRTVMETGTNWIGGVKIFVGELRITIDQTLLTLDGSGGLILVGTNGVTNAVGAVTLATVSNVVNAVVAGATNTATLLPQLVAGGVLTGLVVNGTAIVPTGGVASVTGLATAGDVAAVSNNVAGLESRTNDWNTVTSKVTSNAHLDRLGAGDGGGLTNLPSTFVSVPAETNSAGLPGQMAYTTNYLFICTASNVWRRISLTTF